MQNTYAVAHDTSKQSGGSALQAHLSGLQAVASRASHDGYALATQHPTPAPDVSDHPQDLIDAEDTYPPALVHPLDGMLHRAGYDVDFPTIYKIVDMTRGFFAPSAPAPDVSDAALKNQVKRHLWDAAEAMAYGDNEMDEQAARIIERVRAYDAAHLTPAPDVSDAALRESIARELYDSLPDSPVFKVFEAGDGFESPYSVSWDWALLNFETDARIRHIWDQAGRIAALASSVAAVGVPSWVTHVEVELQGHDPAWPNGTRMQEGMGATVGEALAAAIADAVADAQPGGAE